MNSADHTGRSTTRARAHRHIGPVCVSIAALFVGFGSAPASAETVNVDSMAWLHFAGSHVQCVVYVHTEDNSSPAQVDCFFDKSRDGRGTRGAYHAIIDDLGHTKIERTVLSGAPLPGGATKRVWSTPDLTDIATTFRSTAPSITVQLGDTVLIGPEVFACVYKSGGLFDNGRGVACAYLPRGTGTTVGPTTQGVYVSDHVAVVATPGNGHPVASVIKRHYTDSNQASTG